MNEKDILRFKIYCCERGDSSKCLKFEKLIKEWPNSTLPVHAAMGSRWQAETKDYRTAARLASI